MVAASNFLKIVGGANHEEGKGKGQKKHLVQDFILDVNVKGFLLGIFQLATKFASG